MKNKKNKGTKMATLTLDPTSGTIEEGGVFTPPTITAKDDNNDDAKSKVTGPVPAPDVNAVGDQTLVYTLPAGADIATEVTKSYTLTVTAKPTDPVDGFKDGTLDRKGNGTSAQYQKLVVDANDGVHDEKDRYSASGLHDTLALDPYEVALAGKQY